MKFERPHKREIPEPQLATMIDVFSILIIFLIAGTAMDSSVLIIPTDLILAETTSKSTSLNSPQVTIKGGQLVIDFLNETVPISQVMQNSGERLKNIDLKLKEYLLKVDENKSIKTSENHLLRSINIVADKTTPYREIFSTIKYFRNQGFQNSILVGIEKPSK